MTNPPEGPSGPADPTPQQPPQQPPQQSQPTQPTEPYPPQQPPAYPTQPYPQPAYAQQPPPSQGPLDAAHFYPQENQPPYGYTVVGQEPPKHGNGPGLAALICGIVAIIAAVIPFVNFLAFPIGVSGLILGIVGLVLVNRPRRMAIWGTILSVVSLILAFVMIFVYTFGVIFAVSGAVDEATRNRPTPNELTAPPSPTESVAEILPLGTVVELTDETGEGIYAATVSASVLDATDQVSAIEINPDAPAGTQWAMVTIDVTSLADTTVSPALEVTVEYVTPDGDTYTRLDAFALAPEPSFDTLFELDAGESGTGNVVIAIPSDDPTGGVWAIKYGTSFDGGDRYYFEVE